MSRIICLLTQIPIRKEPSHKSEMVSQLLFGEKAIVVSHNKEWIEIRTEFDNYSGWIEYKSVELFEAKISEKEWIINSLPLSTLKKDNSDLIIPAGSEFPYPDSSGSFTINNSTFKIITSDIDRVKNPYKNIVTSAYNFANAPYLWGGRTVMGIDCSGFIQLLFKIYGIRLPRDASDQFLTGVEVNSITESRIGDLFFFNNQENKITHVGMHIEHGKIIHSSGFVRIDTIDDNGIFNEDTGEYTHNLKVIKRPDLQ